MFLDNKNRNSNNEAERYNMGIDNRSDERRYRIIEAFTTTKVRWIKMFTDIFPSSDVQGISTNLLISTHNIKTINIPLIIINGTLSDPRTMM